MHRNDVKIVRAETVTIRITYEAKSALEQMAALEGGSVAAQARNLVIEGLKSRGVDLTRTVTLEVF